jgi:hypothetical protein
MRRFHAGKRSAEKDNPEDLRCVVFTLETAARKLMNRKQKKGPNYTNMKAEGTLPKSSY